MDFYQVNQVAAIASIVVDAFLIVQIVQIYSRYNFPTFRFLLFSMTILIVADLEPVFKFLIPIRFGDSVIVTALEAGLRVCAAYSLLVVFNSLTTRSRMTRQTSLIGVANIATLAALAMTAAVIKWLESDLFPGLGHIDDTVLADFSASGAILVVHFLVCLFIADSLIVLQIVVIVFQMRRQAKRVTNPVAVRTLKNLERGAYIIIAGSFLTPAIPFVGDIVTMVGFLFLIWTVTGSKDVLLQVPTLQHLIVMDRAGLPVFSYQFPGGLSVGLASEDDLDTRDMVYSGAIKGISSLLSEMTGTDQAVEEISLERAIIVIRQVLGGRFAVLLFTGQTTRLLTESFDKFTADIPRLLERLEPHTSLTDDKEAQAFVLKCFATGVP